MQNQRLPESYLKGLGCDLSSNTEATRTGSAGSEKPPSDGSRSTASDSTKGEDTITEPEEQRQQSDPGGGGGQIYRGVYEAAYMVATTLGTGRYTGADIFEIVMGNRPSIEDVTHGKQQLLVVQYAIINALKDAEAVGKIRMYGNPRWKGPSLSRSRGGGHRRRAQGSQLQADRLGKDVQPVC